jgi:hypothetical protein
LAAALSHANIRYRVETKADRTESLRSRFTDAQLALLEKLNRADADRLEGLSEVVLPMTWIDGELSHSALPRRYPSSDRWPKFLVVHLPGQLFGAYESGTLVRWGPLSSGGPKNPTRPGLFSLNWRSTGRRSTVNPDWFMQWYFNFGNHEGLAFHAHTLPGYPTSHGCIRLLERDAQWLFEWGETWALDPTGSRVQSPGTPVFIVGRFDFDTSPPWRSEMWLSQPVELPPLSIADSETLTSVRRPS